MGKILIIRGVSFTPPSETINPDPITPDPVTPDPPVSDYSFYYLSTDGNWYNDRSAAGSIISVSLLIADTWESDITSISSSFSGNAIPSRRLLFVATSPFDGSESFTNTQSRYSAGDQLSSTYEVSSSIRLIHIWLDDGGSDPLSSSRIDAIMELARQNITFTHG